jgi:hypothetical protein
MGSTFPCNSLIGYSSKWHYCSLVWPKSLTKSGFNHSTVIESPLGLQALARIIFCAHFSAVLSYITIVFHSRLTFDAVPRNPEPTLSTANDIFYPRQYTDDGSLWDIFLKFKSPSPQDLTRDRMKRLTSLSACSGEENNSCIIPRNCASSPSYVLHMHEHALFGLQYT